MRRSTLVKWHRWIGLTFGLFLFVQALTGATMVFRDELTRALHHDALTVAPAGSRLPMQSLIDLVRAKHPDFRVMRIDYPRRATDAAYFRLENQDLEHRFVAVDPYRGAITRDGTERAWPMQWLFDLHQELLTGDVGEIVVGVTGVSLLLLTVTAPFVWWPGVRNLKRSFVVTLNAGSYRSYRDLHRVVGVFVVLVLFMISVTGVMTVWRTELMAFAGTFSTVTARPNPKVVSRSDVPLLPVDQVVDVARREVGNLPIKSVRFPGGEGRVVLVYFEAHGTNRPRATDQIWLDGYSGEKLAVYQAVAAPATNQVFDWMLPIHTGQPLGIFGRVLFLICALMLAGLALTGVLQWTGRRKLMRSKQR